MYFAWSDNASIAVQVGYAQLTSSEEADQLKAGIDVSEMVGETILISISIPFEGGEPGTVSFTISDSPIAD